MSDRDPAIARYDLHLHTFWSYDAFAQLESHFDQAQHLGVECIAITEHHVLDSTPDVIALAAKYPKVRVIPSAELTVTTSFGAFDLLCYGFPHQTDPSLRPILSTYHAWQQETGAAICAGMQAIGYDYTDTHRAELLSGYRPEQTLQVQGQTHVSNRVQREYFVERGFIEHIDDYRDVLRAAGGQVPFPPYPAVDTVIPAVKALGVAVGIAHPHGYFAQGDRQRMDAVREECQLDGVECAHQSVPVEFTPVYRAYCVEHGLFSTGGSDSHTDEDVRTKFARHGGEDEWLDELLPRVADRVVN